MLTAQKIFVFIFAVNPTRQILDADHIYIHRHQQNSGVDTWLQDVTMVNQGQCFRNSFHSIIRVKLKSPPQSAISKQQFFVNVCEMLLMLLNPLMTLLFTNEFEILAPNKKVSLSDLKLQFLSPLRPYNSYQANTGT